MGGQPGSHSHTDPVVLSTPKYQSESVLATNTSSPAGRRPLRIVLNRLRSPALSGLVVARHHSAYPKAAERMIQKKVGATRSRSVNCVCTQLLPSDEAVSRPTIISLVYRMSILTT
jgi:hypothetical protein